ncbi:MAG: cysteine desulfurase-like protein [Cyclobacteriaceae bacterium]|nr:cysteine desulfurase-like protein [Cyclobacteriaceae bacterium]
MKVKKLSIESVREQFPSLKRKVNHHPVIFFDGPGGTQVPSRVIRAVSNYYRYYNSNTHGQFQTSRQTDHIIEAARNNISNLLGGEGPSNISIGQNMTSLNFAISRACSRIFKPGDEILITQLDHEANRGPWLLLRENGIKVREVKLLPEGVLDEEDMRNKVSENTRLIAMGMASNAFGTVNNVLLGRKLAYEAGALFLLDAVHYVPHFPVDVQEIGADFLLCSSYKFYGPHLGFLYAKPGALDNLPVDRLRTQDQQAPFRIETGTLNHASLAGVNAVAAFIAALGEGKSAREKMRSGMERINVHEQELLKILFNEIAGIKKLRVIGPGYGDAQRAPTLSFVHDSVHPEYICTLLAEEGIAAWNGNFYAIKAMEVLGLQESGGVVRIGMSMYNSESDIERLISTLKKI